MSEGIDFKRIIGSHTCGICHYCYFLKANIRFQTKVYDGCYDLLQKAMSFKDTEIVYVKGNYYRINCLYMSKDKAINLLRNVEKR